MSDKPRFILQLSLLDNESFDPPLHMAVGLVDEQLRIAPRAVDEMKAGFGTYDGTIRLMKVRKFRKDLFIHAATNLGALLAERMEDAEGWHDERRIEPAREQLGGRWK